MQLSGALALEMGGNAVNVRGSAGHSDTAESNSRVRQSTDTSI